MTPDERNLLSNFLGDLAQARATGKDAEAEAMIKQAFAANPDAAYLIVQHSILSDQALHAAQARIAELEAGPNANAGSSFLGGQAPQPQYQPQYQAQPQYQPSTAVPVSQPGFSPFASGGGLGSFLRSAGTMAAGVAAGDMLFEGLSGLFGGHRGFGFGGMGGGFGGYGAPVENVTINEFDDRGGGFSDPGGGFDDDSGGGWDNN
jgi:uncharacterized protein